MLIRRLALCLFVALVSKSGVAGELTVEQFQKLHSELQPDNSSNDVFHGIVRHNAELSGCNSECSF